MKRKSFCVLIVLLWIGSSCTKDKAEEPVLPTDATVTGYWSLTRIQYKGQDIAFKDYQVNSSNGVKNAYFNFGADKSVDYVFDVGGVIEYGGAWTLTKDMLSVAFTFMSSTFNVQYQISSFSDTQITLVDQSGKDYALTYTRITHDDFPEIAFSATVNGQAVVRTTLTAFYYASQKQIGLSATTKDGATWVMYFPPTLTPGTYSMSPPQFSSAYIPNSTLDYGFLVSGSVTVVKISPTYISLTFNTVLRDDTGSNQVTITNGVFKSIIEPD